MAALQQTPITFRSLSPPSAQISINRTPKLSLSSTFVKLPKLKIKLRSQPLRRRSRNGAVGATMVVTAASSYASALADVAKSNGTLEQTSADIDKLEKIFSQAATHNFRIIVDEVIVHDDVSIIGVGTVTTKEVLVQRLGVVHHQLVKYQSSLINSNGLLPSLLDWSTIRAV